MNIEFYPTLNNESYLQQVWDILCKYDHEFLPPLSARENTSQSNLMSDLKSDTLPHQYFKKLKEQSFLLALTEQKVVGFMSFLNDYICDDLNDHIPTLYISTIIVEKSFRSQGITTNFYRALMEEANRRQQTLTTRTWSTNDHHIALLMRLGFEEVLRIKNGRKEGIDTVYYRKHN